MKRFINDFFRFGFVGICIGLGFFITAFVFIKAANLTATSGTPLTASNWNNMISNFFWGSGSGGIYYNGKVGIGTNVPNRNLHLYDTTNNAEIDIQSVVGTNKHWGIYQDAASEELRIRNNFDRVTITTGGNMSVGGLCLNGTCKSSWDQVGSSISNTYTGTCDAAHRGATGIINGMYKICNGTSWVNIAIVDSYFAGDGSLANPYRSISFSATANVSATSCNYYNLNANTLNDGSIRGSGSCGGGTKACLTSGVYRINPSGSNAYNVYCDMTTDGGGRTWISQGHPASAAAVGTIQTDAINYVAAQWKLSDSDINSLRSSIWDIMISDYETVAERPYRQFIKMIAAYNYSLGTLNAYQRKNGSGRVSNTSVLNYMLTNGSCCYNVSTGVWSNPASNLHIYYSSTDTRFRCVGGSATTNIRIYVR